jgi:phosphatidate cytidylyltransferase
VLVLLKRVFSGAVIIAVMLLVIIFQKSYLYPVAFGVLSLMAVYELLSALKINSKSLLTLSMLFAAIVPFIDEVEIYFPKTIVLVVYIIAGLIIMLRYHKTIKFEQVCICYAAATMLPLGFAPLMFFRNFKSDEGLFFILLIFFCSWFADTFAYFTGYFLGKHKLSPIISPKKTVEGAIGGVIGTALTVLALTLVFNKFIFDSSLKYINIAWVLPIAVLLSVVSMAGDLVASAIKRGAGVKDFGNILPGHGGILDRFDSLLLVAPVCYALYVLLSSKIIVNSIA